MSTDRLTHRFEPHGKLRAIFRERAGEVLVAGPAGTGKSRACLEKLHLMALLNPGMRGLIVRKTARSLGSTALVTFGTFVIAESERAGHVHFYGGSQKEAAAYRYSNGSRIVVGGMDEPMKIMSSEYDVVYVQEATELSLTDWESITSRLRNGKVSFQQLLADCNPDTPTHWLKQRCDNGDTVMIESRHEDNPVLFDREGVVTDRGAAYMKLLDKLTGVRKLRLRDGKWVAADGVIYEEWDSTVHLVDGFIPRGELWGEWSRTPPSDWPRYWVVDFGFTNPFVCQFWAEDPDGRLWLYREIYRTQRLVEDHARDIMECVSSVDEDYVHVGEFAQLAHQGRTWSEPTPQAIICDHDAEGRATLERHLGMVTTAATKNVTDGIQKTQARFRVQDDGLPRLLILRDCRVDRDDALVQAMKPTCTAEEIPGYVWRVKPGGVETEEPVKVNDHGADCVRYIVAERDLGDGEWVRFL